MKIFHILMMGVLIICNPSWGQNYLAARDSRLGDNYNELELRNMPDLPKYAPRPKTQKDVAALFKKAEKENDEYSNYALFSLFSVGCFELGKPYQKTRAEEECNIANHFLKKTLEINPNNVVALYYSGANYKNGYGVKKDILKAIDYYDKAYRIGGNKIFAAIDSLFVIYFYGKRGVPQDLNKAKHYIEIAAKNGSKKHQYFLNNWDTHVFLLETKQESDKCVEKNSDDPKWVNKCIQRSEKKIADYIEKNKATQSEKWQENPYKDSPE